MNGDQSHKLSLRSDGDNPALTALLRSTYTAPTDDEYWAGLEQRVLAHIRESGPIAWWAVFLSGELPAWLPPLQPCSSSEQRHCANSK